MHSLNKEDNTICRSLGLILIFPQLTCGVLLANLLGLAGWQYSSICLTCLQAAVSLASLLLLAPSPYELARAGDREGVRRALSLLREGGEEEVLVEVENVFR